MHRNPERPTRHSEHFWEEGEMLKARGFAAVVGAILLALGTAACGTLTGAAVGAGSGAAIGAATGKGAGKGALIGAGVGAAAGTVYDAVKK